MIKSITKSFSDAINKQARGNIRLEATDHKFREMRDIKDALDTHCSSEEYQIKFIITSQNHLTDIENMDRDNAYTFGIRQMMDNGSVIQHFSEEKDSAGRSEKIVPDTSAVKTPDQLEFIITSPNPDDFEKMFEPLQKNIERCSEESLQAFVEIEFADVHHSVTKQLQQALDNVSPQIMQSINVETYNPVSDDTIDTIATTDHYQSPDHLWQRNRNSKSPCGTAA